MSIQARHKPRIQHLNIHQYKGKIMPAATIFSQVDLLSFAANLNPANELALYDKISGPANGVETSDLFIFQTSNSSKDSVKMGIRFRGLTVDGSVNFGLGSGLLYNGVSVPYTIYHNSTTILIISGNYVFANGWGNNPTDTDTAEFNYTESIASCFIRLKLSNNVPVDLQWVFELFNVDTNSLVDTSSTKQTGAGSEWVSNGLGFLYNQDIDIMAELITLLPDIHST